MPRDYQGLLKAHLEQIEHLRRLAANYDGSAAAAQQLEKALAENHATSRELVVAYHDVSSQLSDVIGSVAQGILQSASPGTEQHQSTEAEQSQLGMDFDQLADP